MRDISLEETFDHKFTTRAFATGIPTTAAGLTIAAYPGNSTTEITAGITTTFTSGFDSRAGLVNVRVVATAANGYATATDYALVVTAGTVDSVSIVGEVVGEFSIGRSAAATRLGLLSATAATGDPGTTTGVVAYLKQLVNVLVGSAGVTTFPAEAAPANAVSLSEVLRAIHADVTGINGEAMRGTDSAATAANLSTLQTTANGIKTKTDFLPSATAGAAGGVFIAGTNAATVITSSLTTTLAGNVTGSVASCTADVGLTATAIDNIWDETMTGHVTADSAGVHLKDIIADTNELQADDYPARFTGMEGATFSTGTDSLEAIRDRGDAAWTTGGAGSDRLLMVDTTIATLATQTSFTLTAGSADNDAYNNCTIVVEDVSTATQKAVGMVLDYVGSTKTVTLKEALAFTIAATDKVYILAENSLKTTVANRQLDVTATGAAGIDWGNVENKTTANDLSATDIQLCDTVTTVTGLTASNLDATVSSRMPTTHLTATAGKLNGVALTDTCTTNTDMRGTDSAALASVCTTARLSELDAGTAGKMANQVDIIQIDTTTDIPAVIATAQADLDIITGATGVNLLAATQASIDAIEADTNELQTDDYPTTLATIDTVVDAIKVITDALGATAAARLALSAGQLIPFTVDTVTNTHTPTATEFQADDITEATADHYNGRVVVWTSGALVGQATSISDYEAVGGIGQFTVVGMTEAPANNDTGIIV